MERGKSKCAQSEVQGEDKKDKLARGQVDMEEKFCSVTLDIIGNAVFNFDFKSATSESPVVKV